MSLNFVREAEKEYEATLAILEDEDYEDEVDKHNLVKYAFALKGVIERLDSPYLSVSAKKEGETKL